MNSALLENSELYEKGRCEAIAGVYHPAETSIVIWLEDQLKSRLQDLIWGGQDGTVDLNKKPFNDMGHAVKLTLIELCQLASDNGNRSPDPHQPAVPGLLY